jgi:hypothetical protein
MNKPPQLENPARRRLARGAAAVPAVLASMTTTNALAGKYHCSVSGKASGNTSNHAVEGDCRNGGRSVTQWKSQMAGDRTLVVDCLGVEYRGKTTSSVSRGVRTTNHRRANHNCNESGYASATCDQVFNGSDNQSYPIDDPQLLMAGLCAYLNARDFSDYHITRDDAAGLYQGALGLIDFTKNGKTWSPEECREHLLALYY